MGKINYNIFFFRSRNLCSPKNHLSSQFPAYSYYFLNYTFIYDKRSHTRHTTCRTDSSQLSCCSPPGSFPYFHFWAYPKRIPSVPPSGSDHLFCNKSVTLRRWRRTYRGWCWLWGESRAVSFFFSNGGERFLISGFIGLYIFIRCYVKARCRWHKRGNWWRGYSPKSPRRVEKAKCWKSGDSRERNMWHS